MRTECFPLYSCFFSCYQSAQQAFAVTMITCNEIRKNRDAFQKTCIIAASIIREFNFYYRTTYLLPLMNILDVVQSFDVYGFCRLPSYFLHPYTAERLDEYAILNQLEAVLCYNWRIGLVDEKGQSRHSGVQQFAKEQLTAFLERMIEQTQSFRTEQEVKITLSHWLIQSLELHPMAGCNPYFINLQNLKIPLKPRPWLVILTDSLFVGVDLACIPSFLQSGGLVNLAPYAQRLGRFSLLSWIPNQILNDWIWGTTCVGYFMQFIQAICFLQQSTIRPEEARNAKWLLTVSAAECVYALAVLTEKNLRWINCLAFIAKSLGLLSFLFAPKPSFFNRPLA